MTPAEYTKRLNALREKIGAASKVAFAPPGAMPMPDPAMGGGMPMDPAMAGGAPPMDPTMMGGAPPVDPAMAGGMPMDPSMMGAPVDPAMAGGAPPMDPAMAGGGMPMDPTMMGGVPPMDPAMGGGPAAAGGVPEDPIMQLTDMVNALGFMVGRIVKYFDIPLDDEKKDSDNSEANFQEAENAFIPEEEQGELDQVSEQLNEQADPLTPAAEEVTEEPSKSDFIKKQLAQFGA